VLSVLFTLQSKVDGTLACLRDVLERISTHPASRIAELLPDQWRKIRAGPDQGESPSTSAGP